MALVYNIEAVNITIMNNIWKELLEDVAKSTVDFNHVPTNLVMPLANYVVVKISGAGAEKFLQGQLTNDVTALTDASWQMTCCCNQKGRIIAVLWLIKHQMDYLAIVERSAAELLINELKKFAVFSKSSVEIDASFFVLGIAGLVSPQIAALTDLQISYGEKIPQHFLLLTAAELEHLPENLMLAPMNYWQFLNINNGIAEVFKTTQAQFTPHQLNLPAIGAVNFKKGCYRGQEIIARMQYLGKLKQHLYKVRIYSDIKIEAGAAIIDSNDKTLGEFVNAVMVTGNTYLALAVLNKTEINERIQLKENRQLEVITQ